MNLDMRQCELLDAAPFAPIHRQDAPNAPIVLGSFQASFAGGCKNIDQIVDGEARVRFTPRESLEFVIPTAARQWSAESLAAAFTKFGADEVTLELREYGTKVDVFRTSASSERSVFVPRRQPVQVFSGAESIVKAVFHLFNWPDFSGPENYTLRTGSPPHQGAMTCGRFALEFDGWKTTVIATENTGESVRSNRFRAALSPGFLASKWRKPGAIHLESAGGLTVGSRVRNTGAPHFQWSHHVVPIAFMDGPQRHLPTAPTKGIINGARPAVHFPRFSIRPRWK